MGNYCCQPAIHQSVTNQQYIPASIQIIMNMAAKEQETENQQHLSQSQNTQSKRHEKKAETFAHNKMMNMSSNIIKCDLKQTQTNSLQQSRSIEQFIPFEIIKMSLSQKLCHIVFLLRNELFQKFQKQDYQYRQWKINKRGAYILQINEALVHIFTSNSYYEGSYIIQDGYYKPHRQGIFINLDGVYRGQFSNGLANGKGMFFFPQFQNQFNGLWLNGQLIEGSLESKYLKYQGQFKNCQIQGKGRLQFKYINTVYTGLFKNSEFEDQNALFTCQDYFFKGGFHNSKKHGYGQLVQYEKVVDKKIGGNKSIKTFRQQVRLKGNWTDDKIIKPILA